MQKVHVFACAKFTGFVYITSDLAWFRGGYAIALKLPHEAGGRGGESTAR
ncbi:hypothetical protein VEE48_33270 [Escherichia coli]|nr:hypothetical protein VEE48_33270 [Escherichia coli]